MHQCAITHCGRGVYQLVSSRGHHVKISNLERDALPAANRHAEGGALHRVLGRQFEAGSDASQRQSCDRDASIIQDRQEFLIPAPALTQQMIFGYSDIGEGQRMGIGCVPSKFCVAGTTDEARVPAGTTIAEISGLPLSRVPYGQ